jgi:hypothetical protein
MHLARLGPERGVNFSHYIRHQPAPDEPDALEVRFLPGEVLILRGAERAAFLRRFDDLDPPDSSGGGRVTDPRGRGPGLLEDLTPGAIPPAKSTRRRRRQG